MSFKPLYPSRRPPGPVPAARTSWAVPWPTSSRKTSTASGLRATAAVQTNSTLMSMRERVEGSGRRRLPAGEGSQP